MRLSELILESGMSERYMLNSVGDRTPPWELVKVVTAFQKFSQAFPNFMNFY